MILWPVPVRGAHSTPGQFHWQKVFRDSPSRSHDTAIRAKKIQFLFDPLAEDSDLDGWDGTLCSGDHDFDSTRHVSGFEQATRTRADSAGPDGLNCLNTTKRALPTHLRPNREYC